MFRTFNASLVKDLDLVVTNLIHDMLDVLALLMTVWFVCLLTSSHRRFWFLKSMLFQTGCSISKYINDCICVSLYFLVGFELLMQLELIEV